MDPFLWSNLTVGFYPYPVNIRLGKECLEGINTPAFFDEDPVDVAWLCAVQPGAFTIKNFAVIINFVP